METMDINFWIDRGLIFGVAAFGALVLVGLWRVARKARKRLANQPVDLTLDLASLPTAGIPSGGPRLTYYHIPVRLVAVVIAPAGREGGLPDDDFLPPTLDHLLPGLGELFTHHTPVVFRWPPQLSGQGFVRSFFHHAALPGARGKGTPWLSIAGRFEAGGERFLAGLICRSEEANNFGETEVDRPGGWIDALRISDD